jgi:MFS family permease
LAADIMNRDRSAPALVEAPTRVRYGVLGFVCSLSMITYLDRVCISNAAPFIVAELGLNSVADLYWVFTAFVISYAFFEIPTGWLGDVFGPRKTLIRIVLWWSFFTALTAFTGMAIGSWFIGLGALVTIRFLFGIGEAGAYPNITRALHNWFPFTARGLAQGAVWTCGRLMGGLTPLVWMVLVERLDLSWRATFWLFGGLGIVWCIAFASWFRNRPDEKPEVNAAERELIHAGRGDIGLGHAHVPWLKLLTSLNLWTLCLMYFCAAYAWYFNITYLPTFLEQQYGVDPKSWVGSLYKGGPLWMGAAACLAGGFLTDWFIRRTGNRKWGRRLFGVLGHGCSACCILASLFAPNAFTFFLAFSLASVFNDLTMGSAWATCQDIGKRYAAIIAGCMNTIGNLGGVVATQVTGIILNSQLDAYAAGRGLAVKDLTAAEKATGLMPGYQINFILSATAYFIAALLWLRVNSTKPVVPEMKDGVTDDPHDSPRTDAVG